MPYKTTKETDYRLVKRFSPALEYMHDGTTKEVSLGYWNGELRLDIRKWDGVNIGKGISLTDEGVRELRRLLAEIDFGR